MDKVRVCDLAKKYGIPSKELIAFLNDNNYDVKAAQSSVEENAVKLADAHYMKSETVKEAVKESEKEPEKEQAPVSDEEKKEEKTEKPAEAAPKKKKNIIIVGNPQNSKMPGDRRNAQGNGQRQGQGNNNRPSNAPNNKVQPSNAYRPLIKPLTPASPTPEVNMVKPGYRSNGEKLQPAREERVQPANAPQNGEKKPVMGEKPNRPERNDRGERPQNQQREGRFENRGDNRGENRSENRGDNRQDRGNRFNNNGPSRNGQGKPNGSFGPGKGFDKDKDDRPQRNGQGQGFKKQSSSFAADAPMTDEKKHSRDEEKRRQGQEKDNRKSKKDHLYEDEEANLKKPGRFIKPEKKVEVVEETIKVITLPETLTIKELADKMKMQPSVIIKKLFMQGKIATVNTDISYEEAENIAIDYEIICEKEVKVDVIEELLKEDDENEKDLKARPPVVCVMGHVDHGKTSLLDAIRKTNVTDREAGGITQHIGAYTVSINGEKITFLDTPGHEAFTAMRMRGANSTDIAILVVAADDGVMPQTVEAINHAKAAGVEIIVAVNKIDKPAANIERVKQEMTEYELIPVDWGGSTEFVPVSAKTGDGIDTLLETVILTSEILELKANPNRNARGLVVEAELDKGRGPVATVLVQKGTLHVGDFISAGAAHGKVRAMIDDKGRRLKEAGPSTPVEILGLNSVPSAGEVFIAHNSDKEAKTFAETYTAQNKERMLEETKQKMSLDDLFTQIQAGNLKELNLIIKADVQGSVEAVKQSLLKLSNEEVVVKCIHGGVGAINESDVSLASASNAIIIGFNVRPDATAKTIAEREGVDVRLYRVIYQAIEDVEAAMKGMLDPVFEEKVIGHAEVRQIFKASAVGNIAGSYILDGMFQRGCKVRISREGKQIFEGDLASLKRFKDDVKEVKAGYECGLVFDGFDQMQELDIVEAYIMVEVPR